ncbi:ABC transporter permease [Arthrobacter sp. NA-172]|uniref:ABC transporter permease n=1 Tax=Arthrobacter sp. NA-172 TaxID=3367524 RepID=UPI003754EC80
MRIIRLLTARNLTLFFRDRMGVFLSLLSAVILFVLYALFLGNLQVENVQEKFPAASPNDVQGFVDSWVFAGIVMITTLTTSLSALNIFVEDRTSGRFKDFMVSPVRRGHLVGGYLLSSFVIAVLMSTVILVAGQVYMIVAGHAPTAWGDLFKSFGYICLLSAAFSALSSFIVTFIKSSGAFSSLGTIVGTIIGFLAGAYIPLGTLPSGVTNVINALPFSQAAMLVRGPLTEQTISTLADGQNQAVSAMDKFYGVDIYVGDFAVTAPMAIATMVVVVIVFAALGMLRIRSHIR